MSKRTIDSEMVQLRKSDLDNLLKDNEMLIERCSKLIQRNKELEEKIVDLEGSKTTLGLGRSQPYGTKAIIASILCLVGGFIVFTQGMAFVVNYSALVDPFVGYLGYSPLYTYLSGDNYLMGIAAVGIGGLLLVCSIFIPITSPRMVGGFILFCSLVSLLVGGGYGLGSVLGIIGSIIAITCGD